MNGFATRPFAGAGRFWGSARETRETRFFKSKLLAALGGQVEFVREIAMR
jgi:hypothetical protein